MTKAKLDDFVNYLNKVFEDPKIVADTPFDKKFTKKDKAYLQQFFDIGIGMFGCEAFYRKGESKISPF